MPRFSPPKQKNIASRGPKLSQLTHPSTVASARPSKIFGGSSTKLFVPSSSRTRVCAAPFHAARNTKTRSRPRDWVGIARKSLPRKKRRWNAFLAEPPLGEAIKVKPDSPKPLLHQQNISAGLAAVFQRVHRFADEVDAQTTQRLFVQC